MIRVVSVALPKSPTNLAQGDEVPQIIARITRQRPSEIFTSPAKRLLQHYRHTADLNSFLADVCSQGKADIGLGHTEVKK
jgi:hypothetical protein